MDTAIKRESNTKNKLLKSCNYYGKENNRLLNHMIIINAVNLVSLLALVTFVIVKG